MREHLRTLIEEAKRVAERPTPSVFDHDVRVTSDVIRLARLATAMHLAEETAIRSAALRDDQPTFARREIHR